MFHGRRTPEVFLGALVDQRQIDLRGQRRQIIVGQFASFPLVQVVAELADVLIDDTQMVSG